MRYLLKPVREEVLFELLEKICDEIESGEKNSPLSKKHSKRPIRSIWLIFAYNPRRNAYLSLKQIDEALTYLSHLEEDLDSIDIAIRTGNVNA